MAETLIRYRIVRVADKTNDQHSASAIRNAFTSSITQEDLQEFILSQVKRIIHGDRSGVWNDDFQALGILSLNALSGNTQASAVCLPTDQVGDVVYISGPSIGDQLQVSKIDITNPIKMPGIAIITNKTGTVDCTITQRGLVDVAGLIPGKIYFASSSGGITDIRPAPSGTGVMVQIIGLATDVDQLLFNPSFNMTRVIP
jgi:hypothetical protein